MARITKSAAARARAAGYRSGLEVRNAKDLASRDPGAEYEPFKLNYTQPAKPRTYLPDFVLSNGIIIDTKGRWVTEDRQKFKMLKDTDPDLDIRLVFSNPQTKIGKNSKTTYGMYATRLGIPFAREFVPQEWIDEPPCPRRLAALARLKS